MNTNVGKFVVTACVAIFGCGEGETEDGVPPTEQLTELDGHIDTLESTQQAHTLEVDAATDLAQITALETAHQEEVAHHLEEMEHTLSELGGCMHDGQAADMEHMHGLADGVASEVDAHVAAMGLAGDLDAATMEEARYAAALADLIEQMHGEHDMLADEMVDHMCAMHEGADHDDPGHHG